jgi:pSer/pThr/pTyr-binding forkhead associated (FHA) protein
MASLCLLGDDGTMTQRWDIGDEPLSVGRDASADIQINDGSLSRLHFSIGCEAGAVVLKDLKSQNGTCVDGKRVDSVKLRHHDCIVAGRTVFLFSEQASQSTTATLKPLTRPPDTSVLPAA